MLYKHEIENHFETICWENTWKIQFCISYKNTQWNINRSTSFMWDSMQHLNFRNKEWEIVPWYNEIQNKWRLDLGSLSIFTPIPQCAQDVRYINQSYMYLFKGITKCFSLKTNSKSSSPFNHTYISALRQLLYLITLIK